VQAEDQEGNQEGNKDMCLDPDFALVEHRPDGQIAFEGLERLLHLDQTDVIIPQFRGIVLGQVGAQQISTPRASGRGATSRSPGCDNELWPTCADEFWATFRC
jgi:hypothetical protein